MMSSDRNGTLSDNDAGGTSLTLMTNVVPTVVTDAELDLFETENVSPDDTNTSTASVLNNTSRNSSSASSSTSAHENWKPSSRRIVTSTPIHFRTPSLSDITNTNVTGSEINPLILSQLTRFSEIDPDIRELLEKNDANDSFVLNKLQENLLTRRIIRNLVSENRSLNKSAFETAAYFVASRFRKQSKESYFLPCVKGKPPSGKLWYRYNNLNKQNSANSKKRTTTSSPIAAAVANNIPQDLKTKLDWLHTNVSPFDTLEQYWQETFELRESLYKDSTLTKYFEDFPVLRNDNAKLLICSDFMKKYGKDYTSFSITWPQKKQRLLELLQEFKDEDDRVMRSDLKHLSDVEQVVPILWLLPVVIPASYIKGKRTIDGKRKRPSHNEVRRSLFLHVKLASDIDEAIKNRREELVRIIKGTLQPTPVFVGPSLKNIEVSYVFVNEKLYKCSSPVEAIEFAFKAFFAFNAEYPDEGRQIWLLIQYYFCNIKIASDCVTVNFRNIMKKLE